MKKTIFLILILAINCAKKDSKAKADMLSMLLQSSRTPTSAKFISKDDIINATNTLSNGSNGLTNSMINQIAQAASGSASGIDVSNLNGGNASVAVALLTFGDNSGSAAAKVPVPTRVMVDLSKYTPKDTTSESLPAFMETKYNLTFNTVQVNNQIQVAVQCNVKSSSYIDQFLLDGTPEDRAAFVAHEQARLDLCYGYAKLFKVQLEADIATMGYSAFSTAWNSKVVEKINQLQILDIRMQSETQYGQDLENETIWLAVINTLL